MLEKCFAFQVRNVYATFRSFKPFKTPLLIGDWGPGLLGIKMNQTHQSGEPINQPVFVIRPALEVRKDWMGRIVQHSARLDLLRQYHLSISWVDRMNISWFHWGFHGEKLQKMWFDWDIMEI
jgi:hypothetical protein